MRGTRAALANGFCSTHLAHEVHHRLLLLLLALALNAHAPRRRVAPAGGLGLGARGGEAVQDGRVGGNLPAQHAPQQQRLGGLIAQAHRGHVARHLMHVTGWGGGWGRKAGRGARQRMQRCAPPLLLEVGTPLPALLTMS